LTDWERLDALEDGDIDLSDIPEITPEMFAKAVVRRGLQPPPGKQQVTIRLDDDVLAWFRAQGKGYHPHQFLIARLHGSAAVIMSIKTARAEGTATVTIDQAACIACGLCVQMCKQ